MGRRYGSRAGEHASAVPRASDSRQRLWQWGFSPKGPSCWPLGHHGPGDILSHGRPGEGATPPPSEQPEMTESFQHPGDVFGGCHVEELRPPLRTGCRPHVFHQGPRGIADQDRAEARQERRTVVSRIAGEDDRLRPDSRAGRDMMNRRVLTHPSRQDVDEPASGLGLSAHDHRSADPHCAQAAFECQAGTPVDLRREEEARFELSLVHVRLWLEPPFLRQDGPDPLSVHAPEGFAHGCAVDVVQDEILTDAAVDGRADVAGQIVGARQFTLYDACQRLRQIPSRDVGDSCHLGRRDPPSEGPQIRSVRLRPGRR